ncbi:MAG: UDP-N-acetylglucosamine 2-epimerase (non-hydrolyzing) [Spirochaetes bacterium]|nr:UDP-N-acetylglucosamine 2-epimerase (non-hydrolyzing) [Spirochaetota bacterium]
MKTLLFIFGTRPESIKLAPLIMELKKNKHFKIKTCITAQHREMLDQVLDFFRIKPDYDLNIMKKNQDLFSLTTQSWRKLENVLNKTRPDMIIIEGDTTTALISALLGFYKKIRVIHIESGLRSFNKFAPFPEEMNRILIDHMADTHFAPTPAAKRNLKGEGINKAVHVVGNTGIDALRYGLKLIKKNEKKFRDFFNFIDFKKRVILVTCHRRESFGQGLKNIFNALKEIAKIYRNDVEIVLPVHLNPNVQKIARKVLGNIPNVHLLKPLNYPHMIYLIDHSFFVLTDSGGIQEEAPTIGRPVLVVRDVTERIEGIRAGTSKLIGTEKNRIVREIDILLKNKKTWSRMAKSIDDFGDGTSSCAIKKIIEDLVHE